MSTTTPDLAEALRAVLAALGAAAAPAPPPPPPKRYVTAAEFAERLGVTVATVRVMCGEGLPHKRPRPRLIRIDPAEAEAWIEARRASALEARRRGRIDARRQH